MSLLPIAPPLHTQPSRNDTLAARSHPTAAVRVSTRGHVEHLHCLISNSPARPSTPCQSQISAVSPARPAGLATDYPQQKSGHSRSRVAHGHRPDHRRKSVCHITPLCSLGTWPPTRVYGDMLLRVSLRMQWHGTAWHGVGWDGQPIL